ncbi:MAG: class I SAM-dependent methyltransferase [Acidobacteriota bacterium]
MRYLISQFRHPRGIPGWLAGKVMAVKNRERVEWGISRLGIRKTDRLLEIGFGPGISVERVADLAPEGFVAGIDISRAMLSEATRRLRRKAASGRIELRLGSASSIPYGDRDFDKVFAINSMLFWPDPAGALEEIRRVLRPGGLVAIIEQPRCPRTGRAFEDSGEGIRRQLARAGFADITIERRPMKPVTCLCVKGIRP